MAPRTRKEANFPKSKCTVAKLKQMYENRLLPHCLSSRYRPGGDDPAPCQGEIIIFASFFLVGLVPSFFEFFCTVISFYDICHLHMKPNSIIMLSVSLTCARTSLESSHVSISSDFSIWPGYSQGRPPGAAVSVFETVSSAPTWR